MARPHLRVHLANASALAPIVGFGAMNLLLVGLLVLATQHGGDDEGAAASRRPATPTATPTATPPLAPCRVIILVPATTDGTPPSWPRLPDLHGCEVTVYAMPADTAAPAPIVTGIFAGNSSTLIMSNTDVRVIDLRSR